MKTILTILLFSCALCAQSPWLTNPLSYRTPEGFEVLNLTRVPLAARIDPAFDIAAKSYPDFAPYMRYLVKVLMLPEQVRGKSCTYETAWAVVAGSDPYTAWIQLSPQVSDEQIIVAFYRAFRVLFGFDQIAVKLQPGCLD